MIITTDRDATGARRRCRAVVPCSPASSSFDGCVRANISVRSGIPWVITHETFSIVLTLVMDDSTGRYGSSWTYHVGKAVQTLQSQINPDSCVRGPGRTMRCSQ